MEEFVRWGAPAFTTVAALMTASNLGSRVTGWGFGVFLLGSILWTTLGVLTGQSNLIIQNLVLSALNVFGMWRWLGRQAKIEEGGQEAQDKSRSTPGETLFPISLLTHAAVVDSQGDRIGQAVEAMAGCRTGTVAYLVIGEGGVAGVGERLHRLDWSDVVVEDDELRSAHARLDALPVLERDAWPGR